MDYKPAPLTLELGRAGDTYFFFARVGGVNGTRVRVDLTAEQYAQLVTGQQINVTAEVK